MAHLRFSGEAGRQLWNRIKDHLWLVEDVPRLHKMEGEQRREAEVKAVAFLICASFGYGCRVERYRYLSEHNRDIYQLLYSDGEEDTADIDTGAGTYRLLLGQVQGFTAVLPLTPDGLEGYRNNDLAISELTKSHLVSWPLAPHSVPFLLLGGVVYFRSIFEADRLAFDSQKPLRATRLINLLLWHIAGFVPRVELYRDGDGVLRVRVQGDHSLPILVCPISALGRGEKMLITASDLCKDTPRRAAGFIPAVPTAGINPAARRLWLCKGRTQ
jgi:hypothetical protein